MFKSTGTEAADVEYRGITGISHACQDAVMQLLQYETYIAEAKLLTHGNEHGFLLMVEHGRPVAVKSGFASGYLGEGPRTLSYVLALLDAHWIPIDEYQVPADLLRRVDGAALKKVDLEKLRALRPVRPVRWYDYVHDEHWRQVERKTLWRTFPPVIPFGIIDRRLMELALSFWDSPDENLFKGFRRLEDVVRARTSLEEHGVNLFRKAFVNDTSKLYWPGLDRSEQQGRGELFANAFKAYRNPRAHREADADPGELLAEFLLLNQLYRLEAEAVLRPEQSNEL